MSLLLGDVGIGSNTPLLVRSVLDWRASNSTTVNEVWNNLNDYNKKIGDHFSTLHHLAQKDKDSFIFNIGVCADLLPTEWQTQSEVGAILHTLRRDFTVGVRQLLKQMGSLAGVPIEPPEQTHLADDTMNVKGCLVAGVPGAGGYDAIFAVVLSEAAHARVEAMWESLARPVLPLILREEPKGVTVDVVPEIVRT